MQLVPYSSFERPALPEVREALPGASQFVHFTFDVERLEEMRETIVGWFEDRDEVIFVDYGTTDKLEEGCIVLEWEGYKVDPLFISILKKTDFIYDCTVYTRREGV